MSAFTGAISTWDYQWHYAMWRHQMLAINPAGNLITNIGFTADAIHTSGASPWSNLPTEAMTFPLRHPTSIVPDDQVDRFLEQRKFKSGPLLARHLERMRWRLGWMSLAEARGCQEKRA
jgi:hypothetical protein